jgi:hypothetical protein
MLYLATKALISGVIVMIASELARRSAALGALVVSLPLVLLRHGLGFYPSIAVCIGVTTLLYLGMAAGLTRFGITL